MDQKYLLFYLKTGGGHLAPAKSISQYYKDFCSDQVEPILCDGIEGAPKFLKTIIEDGYKKSITKAPWVFESLYAVNKIKPFSKATAAFVSKFLKERVKATIENHSPKKIVNFHFLLIKPIKEAVKELGLDIPILTLVTDPHSAHPIWFQEKDQNFILFSENLQKSKGLTDNSEVFPFIVDQKFTKEISSSEKKTFMKEHNLKTMNTVLILGGGDGMPKGKKIIKSLIKSHINTQIVVVCGRDQNFYKACEYYKDKYKLTNMKIFGFTPYVYQLIQISDVVITKCGASTFMEILLSGKIPVVNNYIWEQEKGNMEYIRDNRMGVYERNVAKLPNLLTNILSNNNHLKYKNNIMKANLTTGTKAVGNYILNYGK